MPTIAVRARPWTVVSLVLATVVVVVGVGPWRLPPAWGVTTPTVTVAGSRLVDATGRTVVLSGVNRSGTEYACAQGWGIFDGPADAASIAAMSAWGIDTVRVPLNEHCWLGINGVSSAFGGSAYRNAIVAYVDLLTNAGMIVVLDLHWSGPGSALALGQADMPDADHSPSFWSSVAATFANRSNVVFDLFNEPRNVTWSCWRNGCTTAGGWSSAGMQQLVTVVRQTGARNPIVATGLGWGNDVSGWLANRPTDPAGQLAAGFHVYNFSGCITATCWNDLVAPVAAQVPVVTGEVGEDDCAHSFVDRYFDWSEPRSISTIAWAWDNWTGCSGPPLITSYDGTPTSYGSGVRSRYLARRAASVNSLAVSVGDVRTVEGDTSRNYALVPVTLSSPATKAITATLQVVAGTATTPADYLPVTTSLTFAAGQRSAYALVTIVGDTTVELDERMTVNIASAPNATIIRGRGTVTILDDDTSHPKLTVSDVSVVEGNTNMATAYFSINLPRPQAAPVTVTYASLNYGATAGSDYTATSGTQTVAAGATQAFVAVQVAGDTTREGDEFLLLRLVSASGATIGRTYGLGTIVDDDPAA